MSRGRKPKAPLPSKEQSGEIEKRRPRQRRAKRLPDMAVLEVSSIDPDGELLARPVVWTERGPPPPIFLAPDRAGTPALGVGDRVLARLARAEGGYTAYPVRRVAGEPKRLVGVLEPGGRLRPTDRRVKTDYALIGAEAAGARPGDLVLAEVLHPHRLGLPRARVVERIGGLAEPRAFSLISLYEHDIPVEFPAEVARLAAGAGPVPLGQRADLRSLPLVTIDGADARDFDDAVSAAADDDTRNQGGWRVTVAIADVAHYVRPDDALDREARRRGNSVYFPDRAVPMLPEALSSGWCSLRPNEDRACLVVEMSIDREGRKLRHRFRRALMRSAARLTYEQVQQARDGRPDTATRPLMDRTVAPLYGAFEALLTARRRRGTLDLDVPERHVILDENGKVAAIRPRPRLDSHRLIEEFMIAANVAAAETLEERRQPCLYRVHDAPDPVKIEALGEFLDSLGLRLARGQVMRPAVFAHLLAQAALTPHGAMVHELVLRSQAQAVYAPANIGHFGLALGRYCHFTSPIRRYADLLIHRALIAGLGLGEGGLKAGEGESLAEIGEHVSTTERRAAAAERDAIDRFTAAYLAQRIGAVFRGRIAGVTRFGLFVKLDDSGADGLVPIGTLPSDYYDHEVRRHALIGRRWGRRYTLGEPVWVRLVEAEPVTGGLLLRLVEDDEERGPALSRAGRDRKPPPARHRRPRKGASRPLP